MRLVTYEADGVERLGALVGEDVVDLENAARILGGSARATDLLRILEPFRDAISFLLVLPIALPGVVTGIQIGHVQSAPLGCQPGP